MNMNLGTYIDKKGNLVLYCRHDGGGEVRIGKEEASEVILWLASFQQGLHPTSETLPSQEALSTPEHSATSQSEY
jgi:hypothetical protein